MADRAFDVLAVGELGAGESSRPDGYFLTLSEPFTRSPNITWPTPW